MTLTARLALLLLAGLIVLILVAAAIIGVFGIGQGVEGDPVQEEDEPVVDPVVIAFVPYWDQERGFDSALENLELIDYVSPFWYAPDSEGNVELSDPRHTTVDRMMVRHLQDNGVQVIPTLSNLRYGEWDYEVMGEILDDPTAVDAHVRNIVNLVMNEGYDGIDVDYESLEARDRDAYSAFLSELSAALHAQDKILATSVHAKTSRDGDDERNVAQDFEVIGEVADQVHVMTYDYHWATSDAGPNAPAEWVEEVIAWTGTQIPNEKIILGVALLGYDWTDGQGMTVDYHQAMSRAREQGVEVQRSDDESPWYTYTTDAGQEHEVWFEDAASVNVKLRLIREHNLGGVFLWRLGGEDPDVWSEVPKYTGELRQ